MAKTTLWGNTDSDQDWSNANNWNNGVPVTGDTITLDGNEADYDGDLTVSGPVNNPPAGTFHFTVTGDYTSGDLTDTGVTLGTVTISYVECQVQTCADLVVNGGDVADTLISGAMSVSGSITIQNSGTLVLTSQALSANTLVMTGNTLLAVTGQTVTVAASVTIASSSDISINAGGTLNMGSFVSTGGTLILSSTADLVCSGDFNSAGGAITWTVTSGASLEFDANANVDLAGGSSNLALTSDSDLVFLSKPVLKSFTSSSDIDGGSFGMDIYGDFLLSVVGTAWTNSGTITVKANSTVSLNTITIVLDEFVVDTGVDLIIATSNIFAEKISVLAGGTVTPATVHGLNINNPPANDFINLAEEVDVPVTLTLDASRSNSTPLLSSSNLTVAAPGFTVTQTGACIIGGTTDIRGTAGNETIFNTRNCDLQAVLLGSAAPVVDLPGILGLSGSCKVASIVRGNAATTTSGINFGTSYTALSGSIDGTSLTITADDDAAFIDGLGTATISLCVPANKIHVYSCTDAGNNGANMDFDEYAVINSGSLLGCGI